MATKTVSTPVVEQSMLERVDTESIDVNAQESSVHQNGYHHEGALWPKVVPPPQDCAHLPTFPWEMGWREFTDPETGESCRSPLTLLDIHYPTEDDVGVVFMAQGFLHNLWSGLLASLLRGYRSTQEWLTIHDVLIYWEQAGVTPTAPDLAVIPHGKIPKEELNSYRVGRDGPLPCFVAEITSKSTRNDDLNVKPTRYAAVGIQEYLNKRIKH